LAPAAAAHRCIKAGMAARDIITIGASAGGTEALQRVVSGFPADLNAAVLIAMHARSNTDHVLPGILNRSGPLPATSAIDGEPIEMGRIFVAPPDFHLILNDGRLRLSHAPRENLQRPSINALFRSAASTCGDRVAGVVLTGLLDDGAAGLWEIQQHGGATIVQDPDEATFRSMPDSAIRGLAVQYIVRLAEIPPLLARLTLADEEQAPEQKLHTPAERSGQACPECGGAMTEVRMGELTEYRCHIGHRFGLQSLIVQKSRAIERALESALAHSEEMAVLLESAEARATPEQAQKLREELEQARFDQSMLRNLTVNRRRPKFEVEQFSAAVKGQRSPSKSRGHR